MNPPVTAAQLTQPKGARPDDTDILTIAFDDNRLLSLVCGEHDEHLALIEHRLSVDITPRGNRLAVKGPAPARAMARDVLSSLYNRAKRGLDITKGEVDGAIRMREDAAAAGNAPAGAIRTRRKLVMPRTPAQGRYIEAIRHNELVFGVGPAGTGKTYLAVACAAEALMNGDVDRIVLSRPAVEAGERLGFLPGDMKEKVDPYLRPLYDALYDVMPASLVAKGMAENQIEIAPLAFMRGRTLAGAFIILDEAQNTTPQQMKMFLTRLGEGSRMVVTGDPTQVDLPNGVTSGLADAVATLKGVDSVAAMAFANADIVRHALVGRIVQAYDKKAKKPRA
ncbi:PhoH family protein [Aestuariivirga sp.]|uniref:PhoH family protein n=1 Tax=Aestuariivirga sp. TaxID=2650926 RepID=UPI0039E45AD3